MKRFLTLLLSLIMICCAVVFSVSMVGCKKKPCKDGKHVDKDNNYVCDKCETQLQKPHTHNYGTEWITDENEHWKLCSCNEMGEKGAHVDADNNDACDVCNYDMSEEPAPGPGPEEPTPPVPGDDPSNGTSIGGGVFLPPLDL